MGNEKACIYRRKITLRTNGINMAWKLIKDELMKLNLLASVVRAWSDVAGASEDEEFLESPF